MENKTSILPSKQKETKGRYYLSLSSAEHIKFTALAKSLGMSKSKIVRIMVIEESNIMLCNTVELIKALDTLGTHLAKIRNSLEPTIPSYFTNQKHLEDNRNISSKTLKNIEDYFQTLGKIEAAFSELLKIIKKMK
jgi:DNA-binding transcriptional MerR regulator